MLYIWCKVLWIFGHVNLATRFYFVSLATRKILHTGMCYKKWSGFIIGLVKWHWNMKKCSDYKTMQKAQDNWNFSILTDCHICCATQHSLFKKITVFRLFGFFMQAQQLPMVLPSKSTNKKAQLSVTNPHDAKACQKLLQFDVLTCTTLSLTILVYLRLAVGWSKICEIPRNSLKIQTYRVQGHPRSSILMPIESAYVLSY